MDTKMRITTILLIEKIANNQEYAQDIGISDGSHYRRDNENTESKGV